MQWALQYLCRFKVNWDSVYFNLTNKTKQQEAL